MGVLGLINNSPAMALALGSHLPASQPEEAVLHLLYLPMKMIFTSRLLPPEGPKGEILPNQLWPQCKAMATFHS